MRLSI